MTKAQFEVIAGLLSDIREALVGVPDEPVDGCPHERRVSLATPGDPYHWICLDCKEHITGPSGLTQEYREARATGPTRAAGPIAPGGQDG